MDILRTARRSVLEFEEDKHYPMVSQRLFWAKLIA